MVLHIHTYTYIYIHPNKKMNVKYSEKLMDIRLFCSKTEKGGPFEKYMPQSII